MKNRVARIDNLSELKECLRGFAKKIVPEAIDIQKKAFSETGSETLDMTSEGLGEILIVDNVEQGPPSAVSGKVFLSILR